MALIPGSSPLWLMTQNAFASGWQKLQGLFGSTDLMTPEESLSRIQGIDPAFIPRAPMSNANLDVSLLNELGRMGLKRGKEVTAETHPQLYADWSKLCMRAGLQHRPQLILAESKTANAMTIGDGEVVVSTGLMKLLNRREMKAVLGHELGHEISNHTRPRVLAMAAFGLPGVVLGNEVAYRGGIGALVDHTKPNPNWFKRAVASLFGKRDKPASLLGYAGYMMVGGAIGGIVANQVSVRPTELDADRKAVAISGDPEGLASALAKLEAARGQKTPMHYYRQIRSGYPTIEARIERIREMGKHMPVPQAPAPQAVADAPSPQIHAVVPAARVAANTQVATAEL